MVYILYIYNITEAVRKDKTMQFATTWMEQEAMYHAE